MKASRFALLFLLPALVFALTACGGEDAEPEPAVEIEYDTTGAYVLSDADEAIITGISTRPAVASEDNYRVFYEIFVASFSDSDGDGIGDLRGIINRMDYLNDGDPDSGLSLGVEGIWLTPVFLSPSYHKYDVTDYYQIDPDFGMMDDLRELIDLCHERGVKLILDLPINHTASNSAWFKAFAAAHRVGNKADPYYYFYSFVPFDTLNSYLNEQELPENRTFRRIPGSTDYYECNFSSAMPELNFDNYAVGAEMLAVAEYYLGMGVDGFRFDAAKYIYFRDHARCLAFWDWYMGKLRELSPDIYAVAEVWDGDSTTGLYYPYIDCFNFTPTHYSDLILGSANGKSASRYTSYIENYLKSYIDPVKPLRDDAKPVFFLFNHDDDRAANLYGVGGRMKVAANLYLLSCGSSFIYYGEEIGLGGVRGYENTDANRRLAMLWGDGDTVEDPEGATYKASKQIGDTVAGQLADGDSLLSYYKKLIMIRKANPEIARGEYRALFFPDTNLGGFTSTWEDSTVCVLHNTTMREITVDLSDATDLSFNEIAAAIGVGGATLDGTTLTLDGQTSVVLRDAPAGELGDAASDEGGSASDGAAANG